MANRRDRQQNQDVAVTDWDEAPWCAFIIENKLYNNEITRLGLLNQASIRRFIFTLLTGYLAIFGVRQIPYEFSNEWLVLLPVLIIVYILTTWLDRRIFKDDVPEQLSPPQEKKKKRISKNSSGFGR